MLWTEGAGFLAVHHGRSWFILMGQVHLLREAALKLLSEGWVGPNKKKVQMRAGKSMFRQKEQHLQNPGLEGGTCGGHWGEQGQDTHSHQLCTKPLAEVQAAYLSRPHLDSPTALHSYPTSPGFRLRSYPSSFNTCFSVGLLETNCSMSFQKISLFHLFFFSGNTFFPQQLYWHMTSYYKKLSV